MIVNGEYGWCSTGAPTRLEKTDAARIAEQRADRMPLDEVLRATGLDREDIIPSGKFGFPSCRTTMDMAVTMDGMVKMKDKRVWSRLAVQTWQAEFLAFAAKIKKPARAKG